MPSSAMVYLNGVHMCSLCIEKLKSSSICRSSRIRKGLESYAILMDEERFCQYILMKTLSFLFSGLIRPSSPHPTMERLVFQRRTGKVNAKQPLQQPEERKRTSELGELENNGFYCTTLMRASVVPSSPELKMNKCVVDFADMNGNHGGIHTRRQDCENDEYFVEKNRVRTMSKHQVYFLLILMYKRLCRVYA
ncbi:hypothetical protein M514_26417 [Trichuris suis]|uniref:Uncharacterized protein n=1 Tax=Trichuris suis TaxID=68888 RepID=A0A085MW19_9BILA|nr:hypothetical protein M514_26417 [Trichuris suis]